MPAFITIGILKNDQVSSGGTLSVGQNTVQNRNATKQNFGQYTIGDGPFNVPILNLFNVDADQIDNSSVEGNDNAAGQL